MGVVPSADSNNAKPHHAKPMNPPCLCSRGRIAQSCDRPISGNDLPAVTWNGGSADIASRQAITKQNGGTQVYRRGHRTACPRSTSAMPQPVRSHTGQGHGAWSRDTRAAIAEVSAVSSPCVTIAAAILADPCKKTMEISRSHSTR